MGEGLGGGMIHEVSDDEKYLIVNSMEGGVWKMPVHQLTEKEQWTGA